MVDLLSMARMAHDCYEGPSRSALLGRWERQDKPKEYGNFYACVYKDRAQRGGAVLAIRGSDDTKDWLLDDITGVGLGLSAHVMHLNVAIEYASMWQRVYPQLWLTGHSLGGAYVQLLGTMLDAPGATFNAPGVLNLLSQMSQGFLGRFISGGLHALTLGKVAYVTSADTPMGAIGNYRGEWDPVSRVGVHVGAPLKTLKVRSTAPHPHAMEPIIAALETGACP